MVVSKTLPPVKSAASSPRHLDDPGLEQGADHDEQADHEQQRVPFDVGHVLGLFQPGGQDQNAGAQQRHQGRRDVDSRGDDEPGRTPRSMTTPHLMSSRRSRMASLSRSDITSATRSGLTAEKPRNISGDTARRTSSTITTIGAMFDQEGVEGQGLAGADDDVRRVADQCRRASDVGGEHLGHQQRYRIDVQRIADQQGDRGDQQYRPCGRL